jgi:hypothetical protein
VEGEVVSSGEEGSVVSSVFAVVAVEESPFDGSIVPFPLSQPLVSKNSDATNRQSSFANVTDLRAIVVASLVNVSIVILSLFHGVLNNTTE